MFIALAGEIWLPESVMRALGVSVQHGLRDITLKYVNLPKVSVVVLVSCTLIKYEVVLQGARIRSCCVVTSFS